MSPKANFEITLSRRSLLFQGTSAALLLGATACNKGPSFCNDVSQLSGDQQSARNALGYEETSSQPGKNCAKCAQYLPPPQPSDCGKCKVLPGTVHPNGSCRAFTAKT